MPNEPKQNPTAAENNAISPNARRNARHYALQALYQWQISGTPAEDLVAEFFHYHVDKKTDLDYFKDLIQGVLRQSAQLDKEIQPYLGRLFEEVDPVELAVLRLATYELLHRPDVPYRVVINEALELTKKFGSVEGYKFVNGVLDRVAKKHRATEIGMRKNSE